MIANFFQSLSRHGVEYLLISGQATVLYGAATFSEDIDLWVNFEAENLARFRAALRESRAQYYKLTPPMEPEYCGRGHGFHFVLPGRDEGDVFLDVMGQPPRVASFATAQATSRQMETEWGIVPTIGIKPLVELKKTQRLEDYPIISKLALAWFAQPECPGNEADLRWALDNIFTLPELRMFFSEHPEAIDLSPGNLPAELFAFGRELLASGEVPEAIERTISRQSQESIVLLQEADRRYWREIIAALKQLRSDGKLMPEGGEV